MADDLSPDTNEPAPESSTPARTPPPRPDQKVPAMWRPVKPTRAAGGIVSARFWAIAILLAVFLALLGAIVAWVVLLRPFKQPHFLTIPFSEYDYKLPPLAFAEQDSNLLSQRFPGELTSSARNFQQSDKFLSELETLKNRKDEGLVVHLRCHAVVREDEVFLLPADADFDHLDRRFSLKFVFDSLKNCQVGHRLLILDIMGGLNDPLRGLMEDGGRVVDIVKKTHAQGYEDLLVLCACDTGQLSLVSEEWRQSVFALYLARGLSGAADGWGESGNKNQRITVRELAAYVRVAVNDWAIANRGVSQTPILLGQDDFELVEVKPDQPPLSPPDRLDYPPWLLADWKNRESFNRETCFRYGPRAYRELDGQLLGAEQRCRAGRDQKDVKKETEEARTNLQNRLRALPRGDRLPGHSLFQLSVSEHPDSGRILSDLRYYLNNPGAKPAKTDEEIKKIIGPKPFNREQGTQLLITIFLDESFPELPWDVFDALYKALLPRGKICCVEDVLIGRLHLWGSHIDEWNPQAALLLVRAVHAEEQAIACDAEAVLRFRDRLAEPTRKRREATALMLQRFNPSKARPLLKEARDEFIVVTALAQELAQARRVADEALVVLPDRFRASAEVSEAAKPWNLAVQDVARLLNLLDSDSLPTPDEVKELTSKIKIHLDAIRLALDDRKNYVTFSSCLRTTQLDSQTRLQTFGELDTLGRSLPKFDWSPDVTGNREVAPTLAAPLLPERRARQTIALLDLAGYDRDKLRRLEALFPVGQPPSSSALLGLREALVVSLPDQFNKERSLAAAARLSLALPPLGPQVNSREPAAERRRQVEQAYWSWLAQRCDMEGKELGDLNQEKLSEYRDFFRTRALEYKRRGG